jgi:hypothetical protein
MRRATAAYDSDPAPPVGEPGSMFKLRRSGPHDPSGFFDEHSGAAGANDGSDPLLLSQEEPNLPTRSLRQRVVRLVGVLAILGTLLALAYVLRTNAAARRAVADWVTIGTARRLMGH